MAFTTWEAVRTDIKDKIAAHVSGEPCIGSYSVGNQTVSFRTIEELQKLYEMTFKLEELDTSPSPTTRVTYGRYRKY